MSVLADYEIKALVDSVNMITPFDESLLNPASYDVTMSDKLTIENAIDGRLMEVYIGLATKDKPWIIYPGSVIWVSTKQCFNLPNNVACELKLKSSQVRPGAGWSRAGAEWGDPGWHGSNYTIALKNWTNHQKLPVYPGMKVGQVVFHKTAHVDRSYAETGRYNHTVGVSASQGV